jgi:hypothetical protein
VAYAKKAGACPISTVAKPNKRMEVYHETGLRTYSIFLMRLKSILVMHRPSFYKIDAGRSHSNFKSSNKWFDFCTIRITKSGILSSLIESLFFVLSEPIANSGIGAKKY